MFAKLKWAVLSAAALSGVSISQKAQVFGAEPERITVGSRPIADFIPVFICISEKICEKHGVRLELKSLEANSAEIAAALQGGSIDAGLMAVTNVFQARAQGFDMQIVATTSVESERNPTGPNNGILVKDPAIKTGKDLEGKTVGTLALKSGGQAWSMAWVDKTGGDPSKVKWVEMPMPQLPRAVADGRLAAAQVTEPFRTIGMEIGLKSIPYSIELKPAGIAIGVIAVRENVLKTRSAAFGAFLKALEESANMANADQKLAKQSLKANSKMDPAMVDRINLQYYSPAVSRENLEFWKGSMNKYFDANLAFDVSTAVWSGAIFEK
jgi:NitT/TauT family transport system substrate-binding protein